MRGATPRSAFTLAETLVATGLLALVAVSLCGAFTFGFRVVRVAQENVRADQIMVEEMEMLRLYDWSKITNNSFIPTNLTARFSGSVANGTGVVYTATFAITPLTMTESYSNSLRQVQLTLAWTSGGAPRNRTIATFVSQNGIETYKP